MSSKPGSFDPASVRSQFPALNREVNGSLPVFFDGPGGTQMPQCVIDAMTKYISMGSSNLYASPFFTVQETLRIVAAAREHAAAFVNAPSPGEIVFGANMSTITAHFSRSISREWNAGDEIILTALDHSANISYWKQAAADRGVKVHMARLHPEDCTIDYEYLEKLFSPKVKMIAFGLASNVCGTRSDQARIIKMAKAAGAMTFVDAVHAAPHYLPDAKALDCDFMVCSPYKFFGPHLGFLFGKREHLERLTAYKVEPASMNPPEKWETGTKSFEILAGFIASINYLASLTPAKGTPRERLLKAYDDVMAYEQHWSREFLKKALDFKKMKIYGIVDPARAAERTSTFAFTWEGKTPAEVSDHLARANISTGAGNFYGLGVLDTLGLSTAVRAGCVHYNTIDEMERLFKALQTL